MPTTTTATTAGAGQNRAQSGHIKLGERCFYVVEAGPRSAISSTLGHIVFGPWAVIENNGAGKKPLVIREGISGSRSNAERVLAREVAAIAKAKGGALPSPKQEPQTITIRVHGGIVQEVEDVPPGVVVRVVDYDNSDTEDDAGTPCSITLHAAE